MPQPTYRWTPNPGPQRALLISTARNPFGAAGSGGHESDTSFDSPF
jgi:hypothetical protein